MSLMERIRSLLSTPVENDERFEELALQLEEIRIEVGRGLDALNNGIHVTADWRPGEVWCTRSGEWELMAVSPDGPDDYADPYCQQCKEELDDDNTINLSHNVG